MFQAGANSETGKANETQGSQFPEQPYRRGLFSGVTPNVVKLGWVSFLADVSSEMLYPIIPIFITVTLGAPVAVMGVIEGIAEGTASLLKFFSGRWSDRAGRRRSFVIYGYFATALGKAVIALSYAWPVALVGRAVDRFGKGLRTSPRDALLADSVSPEFKGKAFGIHRGMDTAGAVTGPLIALLLLSVTNENIRLILWCAVIPGALSALLLYLVKEIKPKGAAATAVRLGFLDMPAAFRAFMVPLGVFAIVNSSDLFLLLKAKNAGFTATGVILLYVAYNIVYAAGSPYLGGLSDRIGRKAVLAGGLAVFALVYVGFAFAGAGWHLWVLFAVYGLYIAATDGVSKSYAANLVPSGIRGSAMGLMGLVTGMGALLASSVGGVLWTEIGPWSTFAYGALGAIVGAILISGLKAPAQA